MDRITAPELIPGEIENHVIPYLERHKLNKNQVLKSYCFDIMDQCGAHDSGIGSSWEERFLVVLDHIESEDDKIDLAIELMRRIHVPWSDSVDQMMKTVISFFSFLSLFFLPSFSWLTFN